MHSEKGFVPSMEINDHVSIEAVREKLRPEIVETEEGITHTIYTFGNENPVRVMFCNPEEMPFSQELAQKYRVFMFGDEPKHRPAGEWKAFMEKMRQASSSNDQFLNPGVLDTSPGDTLFVVQPNPRAILDMALTLGVSEADREEIMEARRLASKRKATKKSDEIIDGIIAAKLLDPNNDSQQPAVRNTDAEALALLALMGDSVVDDYLKQKIRQLKELDDERSLREVEAGRQEWNEGLLERGKQVAPLEVNELIGVHMTRYMPEATKDTWGVSTTFDATNGDFPRATQHFTLNHPVRSAGMYGSWEDVPVCLMMPFADMMATNGKPTVLNTVDTFWEVSPGHTMQFPQEKAWLIKPGLIREPGILSVTNGHEIMYKTSHISPEDVAELYAGQNERDIEWANRELLTELFKSLKEYHTQPNGFKQYELIIEESDVKKILLACGAKEEDFEFSAVPVDSTKRNVIAELSAQPIETVVTQLLRESELPEAIENKVRSRFQKTIEDHFASKIKYQVINQQIAELGYTVHGGGMWAWDGDSGVATEKTRALGAELGVTTGPHSAHGSSATEDMESRYMYELQNGSLTPKAYCERKLSSSALKTSPAMRRLLYQLGRI